MGTINHNALIATTWSGKDADHFQKWLEAEELADWVLRSPEVTNGYVTFFVYPDGSKEGWLASDVGDSRRQRIIDRIKAEDYEDGSSSFDWVEIGYGEYGQAVLRGNNKNEYNDKPYAG